MAGPKDPNVPGLAAAGPNRRGGEPPLPLEDAGQVRSAWATAGAGPARRDYELTEAGYAALDEWAAVMKERARLIAEFDARYLEWVAIQRR